MATVSQESLASLTDTSIASLRILLKILLGPLLLPKRSAPLPIGLSKPSTALSSNTTELVLLHKFAYILLNQKLCFSFQIKVHSGRVVSLGIWDTAGAERFESLSRMYYNGAKAAILCFDPCDRRSFDKLKFWVRKCYSQLLLLYMAKGLPMSEMRPHMLNIAIDWEFDPLSCCRSRK